MKKRPQPLPMSDKMMQLIARRFRMLGDVTRLRILQALEAGELTVNQVTEQAGGTQPNVSKHLQALTDAGLLDRRRSGNSIFYSIADPVIFKLCDLVCQGAKDSAHAQLGGLAASGRPTRRK